MIVAGACELRSVRKLGRSFVVDRQVAVDDVERAARVGHEDRVPTARRDQQHVDVVRIRVAEPVELDIEIGDRSGQAGHDAGRRVRRCRSGVVDRDRPAATGRWWRWRWWWRWRRWWPACAECLGRRCRRGAVVATRCDQRVTNVGATREGASLVQRRLVAPRVRARVVTDRGPGRQRAHERSPHLALRQERIPAAELEEPTRRRTTTRHIVRERQIRARRPRVGSDVVVVTQVDHRVRPVTTTGHIHMAIDDRRARTTNSMRDRGLHSPRIRNRVVLPRRVLRRVDRARVIARNDVDLPVPGLYPDTAKLRTSGIGAPADHVFEATS